MNAQRNIKDFSKKFETTDFVIEKIHQLQIKLQNVWVTCYLTLYIQNVFLLIFLHAIRDKRIPANVFNTLRCLPLLSSAYEYDSQRNAVDRNTESQRFC